MHVNILQHIVNHVLPADAIVPPEPHQILDGDPQLYVCKIDLKNLGISEEELLDGVKIVTLPTISEFMLERETLMC